MAVAAGPALRPLSPLPSELTGRARQPWEASAPCVPPRGAAALGSRIWGFEALLRVGAGLLPRSALGQRQNKTKRGAAEGKKKNRKRKKQLAAFALVLNYHNPS